MSYLEEYNTSGGNFDFDTPESFKYKNLRDLYAPNIDNTFKLNAMFINTKSIYGDAPVFVTDNELVNIPQHETENVKRMIADERVIIDANNGNLGFEIYEYDSKKYGKQHSIRFKKL